MWTESVHLSLQRYNRNDGGGKSGAGDRRTAGGSSRMGASTLVDVDIDRGRRALKALDDAGLKVRSALWLFAPAASDWRLRLTMPLVDQEGTRAVYERVRQVLATEHVDIPVWSIQVVGTRDPVTKGIRKAIRTRPTEISGIRMRNNVVDDQYIEDAYIYRSA